MIYKILIRANKAQQIYKYYQVQDGTELVDYETEYLKDLIKTYKSLLSTYNLDQLKVVHELEPEIIINIVEDSDDGDETI